MLEVLAYTSVRARLLIAASVLALLGVLLSSVLFAAPVLAAAAVDPCGAAPDWWNGVAWAQYEACEAQNGGIAAQVTGVTSPVLDSISSSLSSMAGNITGPINDALSGLGSTITSWFTPTDADLQVMLDTITEVQKKEPFHTAASLAGAVTALQTSWQSISTTGDVSFGADVGRGVKQFLDFLQLVGIPQSFFLTVSTLTMYFLTLVSIGQDIGVRVGVIEQTDRWMIGRERAMEAARMAPMNAGRIARDVAAQARSARGG